MTAQNLVGLTDQPLSLSDALPKAFLISLDLCCVLLSPLSALFRIRHTTPTIRLWVWARLKMLFVRLVTNVRFPPKAAISGSGQRLPIALIRADPCGRSGEAVTFPAVGGGKRGYVSAGPGRVDAGRERDFTMHRIVVACAALMLFASPVQAQQTAPDSSAPALPPSFVPPPPAKVYGNIPRPHHGATTRHRSAEPRHTAARHATKHHEVSKRHEKSKRHETTKRHEAKHQRSARHEHARREERQSVHLSKRTIRQCHAMSYRGILRNSNCRSLMRDELAKSEHRTSDASRHHKSSHKSASANRKSAAHKKATAHKHERSRHHRH